MPGVGTWIPIVKERPELDQDVLVRDRPFLYAARFRKDCWELWSGGTRILGNTHWQPYVSFEGDFDTRPIISDPNLFPKDNV